MFFARLKKIPSENFIPVFFGLLYILLPTKMYYIDGIYYAEHLENIPWHVNGFHPHHLLYLPIAHFFFEITTIVIPHLRAITFLQVTNSIFGAFTIWIFMLILRRIGLNTVSRVFSAIILGSSYTFWHHSTDANIYIPAHLILTIVIYIVLSEKFKTSSELQIFTGILLGLAGLIHQISLAVIIPIIIFIIYSVSKSRIQTILRFLIPVVLIICIAYPMVFALYHGDVKPTTSNFIRWVTAFGQAEHYFATSEKHGAKPINYVAKGHTHAFFPLKPLEKILYDQKSGDTKTKIGLYRYFLFLTFVSFLIYIWIWLKTNNPEKKAHGLLMTLMFLLYFAITSIFMPENHFYRIFYLPSLIAILALTFSSFPNTYRIILKPVIGIVIVAFFISNLTRGILPESKVVYNPYLALTGELNKITDEKDVIIFASRDRYFTGIYRYFGNGDALHLQTGKHFIDRDLMFMELDKYEAETIEMLRDRYNRIFVTRDAVESKIDPLIFTPNNYRLPHPRFMVVRREKFTLKKWIQVGDLYLGEIRPFPGIPDFL